jgi:hypothetical protein
MTEPTSTPTPAPDSATPNLPAPPGAPVNPGASSFVSYTGETRAMLSTTQLEAERKGWAEIFDRNAASARFDGRDMAAYSAEARAAWLAKFDAAALADRLTPVEAPSVDEVRHAQEHMLPAVDPRPADFNPSLGKLAQELPPERFANVLTETRQFAADMNFLPELGVAVIDRVAELGPQLKAMTPEARAGWIDKQEQIALRLAGSEEALAEMKERAKTVLTASKNKLAGIIASDPILADPWLLTTLVNHSRALELWAAK